MCGGASQLEAPSAHTRAPRGRDSELQQKRDQQGGRRSLSLRLSARSGAEVRTDASMPHELPHYKSLLQARG